MTQAKQFGPSDRVEPRWTFSDTELGITTHARVLNTPVMQRMPGMTNEEWLVLAGGICRTLNTNPAAVKAELEKLEGLAVA